MSYICGAGSDSAPHPRIGARASATGRALACQTPNKILDICIMKFRMDSLHYALLAVVVLLAVYCGASFFREVETAGTKYLRPGDSPLALVQVPAHAEVA